MADIYVDQDVWAQFNADATQAEAQRALEDTSRRATATLDRPPASDGPVAMATHTLALAAQQAPSTVQHRIARGEDPAAVRADQSAQVADLHQQALGAIDQEAQRLQDVGQFDRFASGMLDASGQPTASDTPDLSSSPPAAQAPGDGASSGAGSAAGAGLGAGGLTPAPATAQQPSGSGGDLQAFDQAVQGMGVGAPSSSSTAGDTNADGNSGGAAPDLAAFDQHASSLGIPTPDTSTSSATSADTPTYGSVDAPFNAPARQPFTTAPAPVPPATVQPTAQQNFTPTTVGLSGGRTDTGLDASTAATLQMIGAKAQQYGLGQDGAQAAQAVGVTEGALAPRADGLDVGDNGQSFGWAQLYRQGQLPNFAADMGLSLDDAGQYARAHPDVLAAWALSPRGTNGWQQNGYLGAAIRAGQAKGLTGADLATYAQQHGQVSVSPERAGANWGSLFGEGASAIGSMVQSGASAVGQTIGGAASNLGSTVQSGITTIGQNISGGSAAGDGSPQVLAPGIAVLGGTAPRTQSLDPSVQTLSTPQQTKNPLQQLGAIIGGAIQSGLESVFGTAGDAASAVGQARDQALANSPAAQIASAVQDPAATASAGLNAAAEGVQRATAGAQAIGNTVDAHANAMFPTGGPLAGPGVGAARMNAAFDELKAEDPAYAALRDEYDQLAPQMVRLDTLTPGTPEYEAAKERAIRFTQVSQRLDQIERQVSQSGDLYTLAQRNPDIQGYENTGALTQGAAAAAIAPSAEAGLARNVAAAAVDPLTVAGNVAFKGAADVLGAGFGAAKAGVGAARDVLLGDRAPVAALVDPVRAGESVPSRILAASDQIQSLKPGVATLQDIAAVHPEVGQAIADAQRAGTDVTAAGVGHGMWEQDAARQSENDFNLTTVGTRQAAEYVGATIGKTGVLDAAGRVDPARTQGEVVIAHLVPGANATLASIPIDVSGINPGPALDALTAVLPGWHVEYDTAGQPAVIHVLSASGANKQEFIGRVQLAAQTLEHRGIAVGTPTIQEAERVSLKGASYDAAIQRGPGPSGRDGSGVPRGNDAPLDGPGISGGTADAGRSAGEAASGIRGASAAAAGGGPEPYLREASTNPSPVAPGAQLGRSVARGAIGGAISGGFQEQQQTGQVTPAGILGGAALGGARGAAAELGPAGARLVGRGMALVQPAYDGRDAASPALQKLGQMFEPTDKPRAPGLADRLDAARTALVRAFTDRNVDLSQAQERYSQALGRPLQADEMVAELSRLAADPAADVAVQQGLKPALQAVGPDYRALRDAVTLRSNVSTAEGLATKISEADRRTNPLFQPADVRTPAPAPGAAVEAAPQSTGPTSVLQFIREQGRTPTPKELDQINEARRVEQARAATPPLPGPVPPTSERVNAPTGTDRNAAMKAVQEADYARTQRLFSGGLTAPESRQALEDLQQTLGPDRWATVQKASDQVFAFSKQLRDRLVQSGVLSQQQADDMERLYPQWAKTRVLDYMADSSGAGMASGKKLGLSDPDLHAYTLEGTQRAREDPLASMVSYAHQVEQMARKNEAAQALLKVDQAMPEEQRLLRPVTQDYSPTRDQVAVTMFQDGVKQRYVTDNKALGEAINGAGVASSPEWTSAWQRLFRSLATSRNPLFLAGNAALDIPEYVIRSTIKEGGPQALPRVAAELAKGYASAFQGILRGDYQGATARFLQAGGGQSGFFTGGEGLARETVDTLRRTNALQVNSKGDLVRLIQNLATLKPVEALGERIELGPRTAAFRLAEQRGENPVQAAIAGRDVTVDFSRGGTVTKYVNNFVPFFNVGFQAPAQVARAFKDNPKAFAWTLGTLLGGPTLAAEAWNRSDPQRAADYADVPDYVKNQGIVIMLPGDAPVDAQGNRQPQYAHLNMRNWAPLVVLTRDLAARAMGGTNTASFGDLMGAFAQAENPLNLNQGGDVLSKLALPVPGAATAGQLAINKDLFRNRNIVTARNDQQASGLGQAVADAGRAAGIDLHPSAVDFAVQDMGAGVGSAVLGASNVVAGKSRGTPQDTPVLGGLLNRFVGGSTGQGLQNARDAVLSDAARSALVRTGTSWAPSAVPSTVSVGGLTVPLTQSEETRYQQLANGYLDTMLQTALANPDFQKAPLGDRQTALATLERAAHQKAHDEVLGAVLTSHTATARVRQAQQAAAAGNQYR